VIDRAGAGRTSTDRTSTEQTAHEVVLDTVRRGIPPGASLVIEGAAGIGKTFLARKILASLPPGAARVIYLTAEQGRRHDPLAAAGALVTDNPDPAAAADSAFDRVDELCASGPVVLWADDAQFLDAATLSLLRRLVWASRSLPLVVLITTRPAPSREPLAMLISQVQTRLVLPPMGRMMVERLVFDRTGRWPGPALRRALEVDVPALCAPELAQLVRGTIDADPDAIEAAAGVLAQAGRGTLDAFAREELACAAAAAGDRDRATGALDAALAGYQRMGATADRDRALQRVRALGIRRGPRVAHAGTDSGWAALTPTETRIAVLVREGLTNREIGTRMYVSPRTVQTHVSHILQKTGLRSRVEVARAAGEQIRRLADVSLARTT
jgi:DNA-binding CsgD family transcriptional regulator